MQNCLIDAQMNFLLEYSSILMTFYTNFLSRGYEKYSIWTMLIVSFLRLQVLAWSISWTIKIILIMKF